MNKKTDQCSSCHNLNKKLKVLQADYDFEIKKISEDKSTEKALLELSTNREIKKLQQKCLKQKQQRVKQNQLWMSKYDELIERQRQQTTQYKIQKDKQVQNFKKTKNQEVQMFKKQTVYTLQEKIKNLIVEKNSLKTQMTQKHEKEVCEIKKSHDDKISKLILKHEENINKKCQQYEATILGIQSEKNVEENLHKKTKEESKDAQSRLNQQIYSLKRNIFELDDKITRLKSQIQQKCQKIQTLHGEMLKMQNNFFKKQQELLKEYDEKYESQKQQMQANLQKIFKRQLQNCTKYEKALEKIQQHRQMQNQMYKANLSEIKGCVEERPSRFQDVEEIVKLKEKLTKKQRLCDSLSEELKYYRLELQNKEETYNKIFGPESKNTESIMIRRKDLKMKRNGKSVATVRQILGSVNINPNILAPLVGNIDKKFLPPKHNKIL